MSAAMLVCPHDRVLLDRLSGRRLCVRVSAACDIAEAAAAARSRNDLYCVICDSALPLSAIEPDEQWRDLRVALAVPAIGRFRDLVKKIALFRAPGLAVHLPYSERNLVDARTLASVGIRTCIVLGADDAPDWDLLTDFMTYALLGPVGHAPMEPFQTIANAYRPDARCEDWSAVYFDDPARFLHLDLAGRIALTRHDLLAGDFVADDACALDAPEVKERIRARSGGWRELFLKDHFCARCPGWRLCLGKFAKGKDEPDGCADFFCEMADVVEQRMERTPSNGATLQW